MENLLMIRHSIVLVPFPFDDFSATKVRPAICLTSELGQYHHVIFLALKILWFLFFCLSLLHVKLQQFTAAFAAFVGNKKGSVGSKGYSFGL